MNDGPVSQNYMVETTDCLEAIGVFRGWKNFFFAIALVCLLLTQTTFWLVDRGVVKLDEGAASTVAFAPAGDTNAASVGLPAGGNAVLAALVAGGNAVATAPTADANAVATAQSAEPNTVAAAPPADVNAPAAEASPATAAPGADSSAPAAAPGAAGNAVGAVPAPVQNAVAAPPAPTPAVDATTVPAPAETSFPARVFDRLDVGHLARAIGLINDVLVVTIVLYVLATFFSLMVSLVGRMGGMRHISRAFFLSVIVLVLAIPWQSLLGSRVPGVLYTFPELRNWMAIRDESTLNMVLYYVRFSGYWVVFTLLFLLSQIRSARWTKSILRRLEII